MWSVNILVIKCEHSHPNILGYMCINVRRSVNVHIFKFSPKCERSHLGRFRQTGTVLNTVQMVLEFTNTDSGTSANSLQTFLNDLQRLQ